MGMVGMCSKVYLLGIEYEFVRVEILFMGVVVGVLYESLVEVMKSFYKLCKVFFIFDFVIVMESKVFGNSSNSSVVLFIVLLVLVENGKLVMEKVVDVENLDSSELVFVDVLEIKSGV